MSVVADIVRTYRAPRSVLRDRLARGQREDRALAVLMAACVLLFVAQWPRLGREAHLSETMDLNALMAGALFGWIFVAPLGLYVLAAGSHVLARALGGQGTWHGARLALFWALLASTPLWLLTGLSAGFIGPGPATTLTGIIAMAAFVLFWMFGLVEAERGGVPA